MSKEGSLALCILICVQLNQKGVLLSHCIVNKKIKNIKNVKRCRDGMPKSMQTRQG